MAAGAPGTIDQTAQREEQSRYTVYFVQDNQLIQPVDKVE